MVKNAPAASSLWPGKDRRLEIQRQLSSELADAIDELQKSAVAPHCDPPKLREKLEQFDFQKPLGLIEASRAAIDLLRQGTVHMMHPGYFGLFNPSVTFPGVLADQITAQINPQLAVWSHAPAAVEIERHTVEALGGLVGWTANDTSGHFTSGGAEANYTAVLMALTKACPAFADEGARGFAGQPRLYVSAESHLAWLKIAHQSGIGRQAVRLVPTDGTGRLDPQFLDELIKKDVEAGDVPVFAAATAGTTNAGMIDPLQDCQRIAHSHGLWFHVDAAWGGAGLLCPRSAGELRGIEMADSITLDAHKWFAVPMGAGVFMCRNEKLLGETFRVAASYMPDSTEATVDPYTHSLQWSRRFIGLKLFLSLACLGWNGYREHVEHALGMADLLKDRLSKNGWSVVNNSPLAVVCFVPDEGNAEIERVAASVVNSGRAWISAAKFEGKSVLRACITSHFTREEHINQLVEELNRARLGQ